ncbi:MAG: ROK family protein [Acidimicrobiales bacterium]
MNTSSLCSDGLEHHLGVDIGGTHFRMGICRSDGVVIAKESIATKSLSSAAEGLTHLAKVLDPEHHIDHMVVGVPGVVDYHESKVIYAPNIPRTFLADLSAEAVATTLGRSVHLVNDADLAAIGESYFGAGKDIDALGYVTISTGVGAAVVYRGKVMHTRLSIAELGHSFIDLNKAAGSGEGSVEFEASGTALSEMIARAGIGRSNEETVRAAENGNAECLGVIRALSHAAAVALANIVHLFSVDRLVIGGGVVLGSEFVFNLIEERFHTLRPTYLTVDVQRATLGDDAGLVGAAAAHQAF